MKKNIIFWSGILLIIIPALSVLAFFVFYNDKQEKIFYFFESGTEKPVGEMRTIPKYHDDEKNIQVYVEELLLGPRGMNLTSDI